jgi:ribonuclease H2 subunit A
MASFSPPAAGATTTAPTPTTLTHPISQLDDGLDATYASRPWLTASEEPCFMGIDEAGRGPVLGPMVYGCVVAPLRYRDVLATGKYADSKTLTEPQRAALFSRVAADADLAHAVDVLSAPTLSARMLGRSRTSLNELACASTERLIKACLDAGCRLEEVYIDTVGDPDRHRARMARCFPSVAKFVVQPRADSAFPVVSAASIVAKVTRDAAVTRLARLPGVREEVDVEEAERGAGAAAEEQGAATKPARLGCGYPSDPQTKRWLAAAAASGGPLLGFAPAPGALVRFSWETAVRALDEAGVAVGLAFEADPPAEGGGGGGAGAGGGGAGGGRGGQTSLAALVAKPGGAAAAAAESCGVGRHSYFRIRRLERLAVL